MTRADEGFPPINTAAEDPLVLLVGAMGSGESFITDMEAQGARQMVVSEVLPTDCGDRSAYEALGFTLGEPNPSDPMFMPVKLPEGWSRQGSSHDMWTTIVDERGLERVGMFYKAAFYDRKAHCSITDVGRALASKFSYDDDADTSAVGLLTDDERSAYVEYLQGVIVDGERYPDIYGESAARAQALLNEVNV